MYWYFAARREVDGLLKDAVSFCNDDGQHVATHTLEELADWLVSTQHALTARTAQYERARQEAEEWRLAMLRTGNVEVGQ